MKRTPLRRKTRLRTKTRLKSGTPPRAKGRPKRFATLRDDVYREWIREQPCAVVNAKAREVPPLLSNARWCDGPVECAHVKSRGAGGADFGNCLSLCRRHHSQQHTWGIKTFAWFYNVDLGALAAEAARKYQEENAA